MKHACLVLVVAAASTVFTRQAVSAWSSLPTPEPATSAQTFSRHCASCHGRNGSARTRKAKLNHARNLKDTEWQDRVSDERIFNSIMNGKGKMPAYSKKLSEKQIDELVTYVRGLRK
jgi:mono/diheme cytochrome c family protein